MESKVEVLEAMTNPSQMLQKIADVKKEFSSIVQEAAAIQEAQKEAVAQFQSQLMAACQLLQKIQEQGSLQSEEKPEELVKLEELLGVSFPHHQPDVNVQHENNQSDPANTDLTFTLNAQKSNVKEEVDVKEVLSPLDLRSQSNEFIELSAEEFESVPATTRGRVKLADVNMAYRVLWRHFKEEDNSNSLGPSEMYKMGLKVSGATGEAKLKVLKSLKLCTISNKMEVKLV
uniref:Protein FAM33A n=1 Tax=Magallana gigas TaxID=29159 RepID=A0A8W8JZ86_MAGGI